MKIRIMGKRSLEKRTWLVLLIFSLLLVSPSLHSIAHAQSPSFVFKHNLSSSVFFLERHHTLYYLNHLIVSGFVGGIVEVDGTFISDNWD